MHFTPLRAKLFRPAPPPVDIVRPRLLQRLDESLVGRVTLVSAPAGFGKSTLVSSWLTHLTDSTEPLRYKTGWVSLDESDNQLPIFLSYLVAAIEESLPQSCTAVTSLLQAKPPPTVEELADGLINCLTDLAVSILVVLDDLHTIDDQAIYVFLARLIERTPPHFHLILITRVDPPLPINRWRARRQLSELRLHDLSFNLEETAAFLNGNLDQVVSDSLVASLHRRTEGWAVGIWLAVLALRNQTDYAEFAAEIEAASSRYIVDYLVDDVLEKQPPSIQKFLISTAILNRFCPGLCAAVVDIDEPTAQHHIAYIARANLFLVELSSPARWYRYHHQFQFMLLSRLHERYSQDAIATLRRQAASWLAAHDQVGEALHHLLTIPDEEAAADLIESQRIAALNELRFGELEEWLSLLPEHLQHQRPALLLSRAWVQFEHVDNTRSLATTQAAAALIQQQAATLSASDRHLLQAEVVALCTALDKSMERTDALALIRRHWTDLRPYLPLTHCHVPLWFAYMRQRLGDLELALEIVLTTVDQATTWPPIARGRLLHTAGFLYWCDGNLAQAEHVFQENLRLSRQHHLPLIAVISRHGLGAIADARNQPELAETHHLEVVNQPHVTGGRDAVRDLYSLIGIYARRGRPEAGRPLIDHLENYALQAGRPYLLNQVTGLKAYIALHCGDLTTAYSWALACSAGEMYNAGDRIPIIRAQILLEEGSPASLHEASQRLEELSLRHASENAWHRLVEVRILQALVWAKLGEVEQALDVLGRAVQTAVPVGMVGPFVNADKPMESLLRQLVRRPEYARQAQRLLAAFPADSASTLPHAQPQDLPEPLTIREIDVLTLLADRLTNKEIARLLIVSTHTVRNHIANLFGKLQVESRIQAVERARELGLLPDASQSRTEYRTYKEPV